MIDNYRADLQTAVPLAPRAEQSLYRLHLGASAELEELLRRRSTAEEIAYHLRTQRHAHGWSFLSGELGSRASSSADKLFRYVEEQIFAVKGKDWYYSMNDKATAPGFTLLDAGRNEWTLSDHRGTTVVLLFYPGDNTPVCTAQLCSVRDHWSEYQATGAEVVGISTDTVDSHKGFAEKHSLPLRLLSDPDGEVSAKYGMKSWLPGRSARGVVVIDKEGKIAYSKVQPLSLFRPKDDEVLAAIREAEKV